MRARPLALVALAAGWFVVAWAAQPARAADIAVSGFNVDVVTEKASPHSGHRFDAWVPNPADWAEEGLAAGTRVALGLPRSRSFASLTDSGVTYALRPYNGTNVLRMGDGNPASGTMDVRPGRYL